MKNIFFVLLLSLFCIVPIQSIFASSGDTIKPRTLLENQEEIKELKKQESLLQFKWSTFKLGNESLGEIIKQQLSVEDKDSISLVVSAYVETNSELEKDLEALIAKGENIEVISGEILSLKEQFYRDLVPYIQEEKLELLEMYADSDISYNEKSKNIKSQIEQKNVEQNERIEELYDDRDDSARDLRRSIKNKIDLEVRPKIDEFVARESFAGLPAEMKIEVFTSMLEKFEDAIEKLEDIESPTMILEERIIGLEVVVEILESYIDSWE